MFYVYLLASRKQGTLDVGVTKDLVRRTWQHKSHEIPGFTSRYDVDRLVRFECHDDPVTAITREREIKKRRRTWKVALIDKDNPDWRDLYPDIVQWTFLGESFRGAAQRRTRNPAPEGPPVSVAGFRVRALGANPE